MKKHCCDDDSGCLAPDGEYNSEDVDCGCRCDLCSASRIGRYPVSEGSGFDKFMDRILISEGGNRAQRATGDSVQRKRAARHQDRPGNKIRFGSK